MVVVKISACLYSDQIISPGLIGSHFVAQGPGCESCSKLGSTAAGRCPCAFRLKERQVTSSNCWINDSAPITGIARSKGATEQFTCCASTSHTRIGSLLSLRVREHRRLSGRATGLVHTGIECWRRLIRKSVGGDSARACRKGP
jgi:hypothetical protein